MLIVFALAIFLSAALLFFVQPMVARMVLPLLGGTPEVWNTCMVFFQALLLAGYSYSHLLTKVRRPSVQVGVHAVVCLLPLAFLPVALPDDLHVPESQEPIAWLLGILALTVGVPFFVLSTTGPLLQRWFSTTDHPAARDPYFLYAASNAGSLIALLGYPVIFERFLRLHDQTTVWSVGYVVLAVLLAVSGIWSIRRRAKEPTKAKAAPAATASSAGAAGAPTWQTKVLWVLLAFAPSSLMLGATSFISTDVAAVPLLWIVPLTIYLLTMILAFSKAGPLMTKLACRTLPVAVITLVMSILLEARRPISVLVAIHMVALFFGAMACHGRLSALRPAPERLTGYFLLISLGGVLGGIFNALISPLIFKTVVEYPVAIVLCSAMAMGLGVGTVSDLKGRKRWLKLGLDIAVPTAVMIGFVLLSTIVEQFEWKSWVQNSVKLGVPALACFLLSRWPMRFVLGVAGLLAVAPTASGRAGDAIYTGRTFFGVQKITVIYDYREKEPRAYFHQLLHGDTIHGRQCLIPGKEDVPLTYYYPTGPLGQAFKVLNEEPDRVKNIAVVGLGTGSVAAYGKPGQTVTYYEIDPVIKDLASDPKYFTYLTRCRANVRVVLGDGRRSLAAETEPKFDVMVLDAFSSDAIPVHLLTVEAVQVYLSRLADRGLLLVHTSNRHLELPKVVLGIASRLNLVGLGQNDSDQSADDLFEGKFGSEWLVLARREEDIKGLLKSARWLKMPTYAGAEPVWTDDYSSILDVLRLW